jgi:hypothetical protein
MGRQIQEIKLSIFNNFTKLAKIALFYSSGERSIDLKSVASESFSFVPLSAERRFGSHFIPKTIKPLASQQIDD